MQLCMMPGGWILMTLEKRLMFAVQEIGPPLGSDRSFIVNTLCLVVIIQALLYPLTGNHSCAYLGFDTLSILS